MATSGGAAVEGARRGAEGDGAMGQMASEIAALVARAQARSSFYRDLLARGGTAVPGEDAEARQSVPLSALPTFGKADIVAELRAHPPLGRFGDWRVEDLDRVSYAPGLEFLPWSSEDRDSMARSAAAAFSSIAGLSARDVVDVTISYHWLPGGLLWDHFYRTLGCTVVSGGPGESARHLEVIEALSITVLFGFTPFIQHLGEQWSERAAAAQPPPRHGLRTLLVGGEIRSSESRRVLQDLWGPVAVVEFYGVGEAGLVALSCPDGDEMHLVPEMVVEVLDPATLAPVPPGEPGEVVVTSFARRSMPVIRYRTGDLTEGLVGGRCACGTEGRRLKRIIGRTDAVPRVRGVFVFPGDIAAIMARFPEVAAYRVLIRRDGTIDDIALEVEVAPKHGEADAARLAGRLADALRERVRLRLRVAVVPRGTIPESERGLLADLRRL